MIVNGDVYCEVCDMKINYWPELGLWLDRDGSRWCFEKAQAQHVPDEITQLVIFDVAR